MAPRNLINLENVSLPYGKGAVLDQVSLGLAEGARIGIVGRNGGGKSSPIGPKDLFTHTGRGRLRSVKKRAV